MHLLDRPVWSALSSRHAALAIGDQRARRYPAAIVPFIASIDDDPASLRSLAEQVGERDEVYFLQSDQVALPPALVASKTAHGVQMVARQELPDMHDARIVPLGNADADDMLALASLTEPGPFTRGALRLGEFFGIRAAGRLMAMAGERMKQPGHTEISGVCTHPQARGQGLARLLSVHVARRIAERGETPYLHAYASNDGALRLYQGIGFEVRSEMQVAVVRRAP